MLRPAGPPVATAPGSDLWVGRGILLGCLGGTVGFFTSGLVHYNLGDQEVAMMFFLLMGLGVRTAGLRAAPTADRLSAAARPLVGVLDDNQKRAAQDLARKMGLSHMLADLR